MEVKQIDKGKLVQLFIEALDKNANFVIHFSQFNVTSKDPYQSEPVKMDEAHELALRFAYALGTTDIEHNEQQEWADDFVVKAKDFRITCSYIPSKKDENVTA
jgi:hypothetical protein